MAFVSVYLGLGSNLGDRRKNIERALELLDEGFGCHYTALSRLIETKAWGFKGDKFLNACVLYRIYRKGTPEEQGHEILALCKDIERALGRDDAPEFDADGKRIYHNRTMDIDILFYGKEYIDTEDLTVPHPLIAERDFVKIPLAEIAKPSLRAAFPEYFM
ncbi:MAG: 2-amino-4-hydroxy-6-hydroxymethyldihydropteridine diphosphokinase [Bacteroidales bacterium]|nr:2-amino-4-hydroxy-6-hydroxymethyldihydropteridine diphosphokinase [Bacteroidales bacterium]